MSLTLILQAYPWSMKWHPYVLLWIILIQVAYLLATGLFRETYGWGRTVPTAQKVSFSVGLWLVYLSEGTPLHLLSENYLFSAHMIQHTLLTLLMPPLVLMGLPDWMLRPLARWRPTYLVGRFFTHPLIALGLFNLIYSIWHMPIAYQATLWFHWFHMVQHAILVFTAFTMWMPIVSPLPEFPRLAPGMQMLYIFLVGVSQIIVFGIITFADNVLYGFYAAAPRVWPWLTPFWDQQIAGIIMKVGGMAVFLVAWGFIFFRWAAKEGAQWGPSRVTKA